MYITGHGILKIFTSPADLIEVKQDKYIKDIKMFTCSASKTACQD